MLVQHQASGKCPGAGMASPVTPGSDVSLHELRAIASVFAALHRSSPGPSRCSTGQLQRTGWDAPSSTALMLRARPMGQRDRTPEPIPRSGAEYGHQFPPTLVGPELEDRPRKFGGWLVIRWHVARQARSHKLLEPRAVGGRRSVLRDSERPSRAGLQPCGRQCPPFSLLCRGRRSMTPTALHSGQSASSTFVRGSWMAAKDAPCWNLLRLLLTK